jgi:NitT/TauT family transport system substrate-binding protein
MRRLLPLVLVALLAACAAPAGQPQPDDAPEQRAVSMRLQWFPQFQFAGYIVAEMRGYYDEAGLDVTINPGGPDLVSLPLVAAGTDQFGSTGADTVLIAREQGIPVTALATWFQTSPVAFMVHRDSGISSPQQFPGRTIGMFYGDNVETEYRALLAATGVDRASVRELPGDYSLAPFLERRVDIWPVYATDQPNTARREGAEVELIVARDYGVQLMGDVLFTTEAFARENPRTVAAFVEATLRGWEEAVRDPDAAIELLLEYNPELDREQLAFEAAETITLLRYGPGARCLGINDPSLWEAQAGLLQELEILAAAPDLDAAVSGEAVRAFHAAQGTSCE